MWGAGWAVLPSLLTGWWGRQHLHPCQACNDSTDVTQPACPYLKVVYTGHFQGADCWNPTACRKAGALLSRWEEAASSLTKKGMHGQSQSMSTMMLHLPHDRNSQDRNKIHRVLAEAFDEQRPAPGSAGTEEKHIMSKLESSCTLSGSQCAAISVVCSNCAQCNPCVVPCMP